MSEMGGPLDLSGADTKAFDPIPAGRYPAEVFEASWETTSGQGKLPEGVPMLNVQFRITHDEYENRRVFNRYPLPSSDESEHADKMQGSFVRFLTSLGYDQDEVMSGKFNLDTQDLVGRECEVVVGMGKNPNTGEDNNTVKGVHPVGSGEPMGSGLL